jgi:hypothetical protein
VDAMPAPFSIAQLLFLASVILETKAFSLQRSKKRKDRKVLLVCGVRIFGM